VTVPDVKDIYEALHALQSDPPVLTKQKKGQVGNQITFYADLPAVNAQVLGKLNELGVIWVCLPTLQEADSSGPGRFVLRYELRHVASGTALTGDYPLGAGEPQKMGSAQTYARRYALLAVTGIAAEDDDNDGAQGATAARKPRETKPKAEPSTRAKPAAASALPAESAPQRPAGPTGPMMTKLATQFGELEVTDRDQRLSLIKDMIGRPISSAKEMTFDEARGAIDAIEKALKTDNPFVSMNEIYARTAGAPTTAPARQAGHRSRNAAEALGTGDMGTEQAPWEGGGLPV
jgi:hypothetical protein